jgi:hemin uptake protein HemP
MSSPPPSSPPPISPKHPVQSPTDPTNPTELDSTDLFAERDTIIIRHNNERYCLRRTRQNRLILTK